MARRRHSSDSHEKVDRHVERQRLANEKHENWEGIKSDEKEDDERYSGRGSGRDDKSGKRGHGDDHEGNIVCRSRKDDTCREKQSDNYYGERRRGREEDDYYYYYRRRRREVWDGYEEDRDRKRRRDSHRDIAKRYRRDRWGRSGHRSHEEDSPRPRVGNRKEKPSNPERGHTFRRREEILNENNKDQDWDLSSKLGLYIPRFKLARVLEKEIQDKSSIDYQKMTWDELRKSINGLMNKVNAANIKHIIPELFAENLIRGRGLFCRSCMTSQMASPDVFASLVAVVNTKLPQVGDLLLNRVILHYQRSYKRNDKPQLLAAVKFIAHLVNQQVVHELIALELLASLLERPTDDSVEVAVGFVKECGSMLQDVSPRGLYGIFERFRGIVLNEGDIDRRVQFLIEDLFASWRGKFQGYPAIRPELDLVEQGDQLTHQVSLLDHDEVDPEIALDVFKPDPQFLENENKYEEIKKQLLGEESESEVEADSEGDSEDEESDDEEQMKIKDETETNSVNLRRTIYLTIMSSLNFEEAGHKLLQIKLERGQEMELLIMLLECCRQQKAYIRDYALLAERFCLISKVHRENLETNIICNVGKFFAYLLGAGALSWHVLAYIRLTEEDTTSSSRIFIKSRFQELSENLGIRRLHERLSDPTMQDSFESIFPKDNPKNTRFAIDFFVSIGLRGIPDNLREYLKNTPRLIMQQQKLVSMPEDESGSSCTDSDGSEHKSGSPTGSESETDSDDRRR